MRYLESILDKLEHKAEHAEEILLEEHALNITPSINKMFYDIVKSDKELAVAVEHLHSHKDIKEKKSLTELLHIALLPYENRTINVENSNPNYSELVKALNSYRNMDFVAGYRHFLFEPLSIEMWQKHNFKEHTRMVFYALDTAHKGEEKRERETDAIIQASMLLGNFATQKRKRYNQYSSKEYIVNLREGIHMRPITEIASLVKKHKGDVWIRTDSMEIDAKSIFGWMLLEPAYGKSLDILYKPKENSEKFYIELESLKNQGTALLVPEKSQNR
ncbi:MAG: HPr family phosphocarrier protein [archaeon]